MDWMNLPDKKANFDNSFAFVLKAEWVVGINSNHLKYYDYYCFADDLVLPSQKDGECKKINMYDNSQSISLKLELGSYFWFYWSSKAYYFRLDLNFHEIF